MPREFPQSSARNLPKGKVRIGTLHGEDVLNQLTWNRRFIVKRRFFHNNISKKENAMRILVFDDNQVNRKAAQAQLKDHDLTVVSTYDEAQEALVPQCDHKKVEAALRQQFGDFNPYCVGNEVKKAEYYAAKEVAREEATTYPDFDVVLTDLLMPASGQAQESYEDGRFKSTNQFVGQEMPLGIFIGLLAAVRARAKYIAVFTDVDHHSHPASACFDAFNPEGESEPTAFTVEDSKVILTNGRNWIIHFDPQDLAKELTYGEYSKRSNTIRTKSWVALLAYLIA